MNKLSTYCIVLALLASTLLVPPAAQAAPAAQTPIYHTYTTSQIVNCVDGATTQVTIFPYDYLTIGDASSAYSYYFRSDIVGMVSTVSGVPDILVSDITLLPMTTPATYSWQNMTFNSGAMPITVYMCKSARPPTATPTATVPSVPVGCFLKQVTAQTFISVSAGTTISIISGSVEYGGQYGAAWTTIVGTIYIPLAGSAYLRGSGWISVCPPLSIVTATATATTPQSQCFTSTSATASDYHVDWTGITIPGVVWSYPNAHIPSNSPLNMQNWTITVVNNGGSQLHMRLDNSGTIATIWYPGSNYTYTIGSIVQDLKIGFAWNDLASAGSFSATLCASALSTPTANPTSTSTATSLATRTPLTVVSRTPTRTSSPTATPYPTSVAGCVQTRLTPNVGVFLSFQNNSYIRALNGIAYIDGGMAGGAYTLNAAGMIWELPSGTYLMTPLSISDGSSLLQIEICALGQPGPMATMTAPSLPCAIASAYQVSLSPQLVVFTKNAQFVVADVSIYVNMGATAKEIRPGTYTWEWESGNYNVYTIVDLTAHLWLCQSPVAAPTSTFAPTWTPGPVPNATAACVPLDPSATIIAYTMPNLAFVIPVRPTYTATMTTTALINGTIIVGFAQTLEARESTPVAGVARIIGGLSWTSGELAGATAISVASPMLSWMAIVNPSNSAWSIEGGPLWAIEPFLLPIMPVLVMMSLVVFVKFALWALNWFLKLIELVVSVIKLIPFL